MAVAVSIVSAPQHVNHCEDGVELLPFLLHLAHQHGFNGLHGLILLDLDDVGVEFLQIGLTRGLAPFLDGIGVDYGPFHPAAERFKEQKDGVDERGLAFDGCVVHASSVPRVNHVHFQLVSGANQLDHRRIPHV